MKLICLEGNIGSGKTTLTESLAAHLNAVPIFEPVETNPYLDDYYREPKRYALEMQFWLMSRRFEMHEKAIRAIWQTGRPVIMDRSIYGDWVFAKKNWMDGNISDVGYQAYIHHRKVMDRYLMAPHVMLFLDAAPATCLARIRERGRACEKGVPLAYLEGLATLHHALEEKMKGRGSKVVRLAWDEYMTAEQVGAFL